MHICLVIAGDEEGGLEKHVVELAAGLVTRGHQVSVIAHDKYRARLHPDIHFYAVNLAKSRRNMIVLFQLWYTLKQIKADLVHAHGNKAAAMVGVVLRFLSLASVATLHSKKNKTQMFAPFDRVIAVSAIAATTLSHPHVSIILNGIHPPPRLNVQRVQPPVVLAVGRLVAVKGFDVLLDAWRQVQPTAMLWIAGEGSERRRLEQLIEQYSLSDRVKLLGERHDINVLMQQASVHVISSHYEGGPYTLAEALLVQTPVVATQVGMAIDHLPAAYLSPINDPQALAARLNAALADLERTQTDFAMAYQWAQERLTLDAMLTQVEQVYRGVVPAQARGT